MRVQYDTDAVRWPDRYEYYREAAASEVAPVAIQGRARGRLRAALSSVRVGDFLVEALSYAADFETRALRNDRMIRAGDPDCYRMCLNITGGEVAEQAGNQVRFGPRDIGVFSLSSRYHTVKPASPLPVACSTRNGSAPSSPGSPATRSLARPRSPAR